jgi:hypothetical protein
MRERTAITPDYWRTEDRGYATPCKIWLRSQNGWGYGHLWSGGRTRAAHVVMWEQERGPVPAGHLLHHLCEQRDCIEPAHLQPVTPKGHSALHPQARGRSEFCKRGHRMTEDNAYWSGGNRACRACTLERSRQQYRAHVEAGGSWRDWR